MDKLWIELTLLILAAFSFKQAHFQNISTDLNNQFTNALNSSSEESNHTTEIVIGSQTISVNRLIEYSTTEEVTSVTEDKSTNNSKTDELTSELEKTTTDIVNGGSVTQTDDRNFSTTTKSLPRNLVSTGINKSNKHAKNIQTNISSHSTRSKTDNKTMSISTTYPLIEQTQDYKHENTQTKDVTIITTTTKGVDAINSTTESPSSSASHRMLKENKHSKTPLATSTLSKSFTKRNEISASATLHQTKINSRETLTSNFTTTPKKVNTKQVDRATTHLHLDTSTTIPRKLTTDTTNNNTNSANKIETEQKASMHTTQKVDENSIFMFPDFHSNKSLEMIVHKLGDKDDDTYWPVAVSIIIGIPAIIVIAVTITVMHKKRLGRLTTSRRKSAAYA